MRAEEGRRLTGRHPLLPAPGAAVEIVLDEGEDREAAVRRLQERLSRLCAALDWAPPELRVFQHKRGFSAAFSAPVDLLYTAVDLLETAAGDAEIDSERVDGLRAMQRTEENPRLRELMRRYADAPAFCDDEGFTLGLGYRGRSWPLNALPADEDLPEEPGRVPFVYVTGTNGKTTTTRMLAAIARAAGFHPGHSSSDGVVLDGRLARDGDWTGPGAARVVLRSLEVDFAILETARGGLMRRGLVLNGADAAVVTNISDDHLSEWGLDDLAAMARAKCVVADAVRAGGALIVNGQNAPLMAEVALLEDRLPELRVLRFADAEESPALAGWVDQERLVVRLRGERRLLAGVSELPSTLGGAARHNVENALAAALAALACGIDPDAVAEGLRSFRPGLNDSRGRLNLFVLPGGGRALLDFAHNPDGLRRLRPVVERLRAGKLGVLLGSAGDRRDEDFAAMAGEVAAMNPDFVVLKELPKHRRGRAEGEVRALLRRALLGAGVAAERLQDQPDEVEAARALVSGLAPGDLALLLVHEEVDGVLALLTALGAVEG